MSLVLAVKKKNAIYVCADTQTTSGDYKENLVNEENLKIKKINNNTLLIRCGSTNVTYPVVYSPKIIELLNAKISKEYLIKNVIPAMIDILQKEGLVNREKNKPPTMDARFLIVQGNSIYRIQRNFNVEVHTDYVSIGSPSK